MERQIEEKNRQSIPEKTKHRVEYIIIALVLLFHLVYFLLPIHVRMAEKSCRKLLGLFFTQEILFEVSIVGRGYVLKSDQIVTKNFRARGMSRKDLLQETLRKRPIVLVVDDDDLDKLTDRKLVVVEDTYEGPSNYLAQYLYPLKYKGKRTSIALHKIRKPEQTAIYAFLRKSYFLILVKQGDVTGLYDRCQSEVMEILISNELI